MSAATELSCDGFVGLVGDYIEGTLDVARRDQLELHELGCIGCQRYHDQLRYIRELLAAQRARSADLEPPAPIATPPGEVVERFKFLRRGAVGPFSGVRWPVGEWVQAGHEPLEACTDAIHACAAAHLPYWLNDELWRVQLAGGVEDYEHKLVARFGLLTERVREWNEACARRFADACAERVRTLLSGDAVDQAWRAESTDVLDEFLGYADIAAAQGVASLAAHLAGHLPHGGGEAAERARQAAWLVDELRLG
jgi:hypothetical protein